MSRMGKKYIIELLDDCPSEFKGIIVFGLTPNGQISAEPIPVEDLTPYTEPDLEQVNAEKDKIYDEARARGYEEGKARGYQEGLFDAWEAARKIRDMTWKEQIEAFGTDSYADIIALSASECIEKIRQYEQEKEMDGLRQNIQTIVDQCGYTLDEIAEVLRKMKETDNG